MFRFAATAVQQRRVERERELLLHRVLPVVHRLEERRVDEAAQQRSDVLQVISGFFWFFAIVFLLAGAAAAAAVCSDDGEAGCELGWVRWLGRERA